MKWTGSELNLFYFFFLYSYLRASTGFNLEAWIEGNNPENAPTNNENNKHPIISHNGKYGFSIDKPKLFAINPPKLDIR